MNLFYLTFFFLVKTNAVFSTQFFLLSFISYIDFVLYFDTHIILFMPVSVLSLVMFGYLTTPPPYFGKIKNFVFFLLFLVTAGDSNPARPYPNLAGGIYNLYLS